MTNTKNPYYREEETPDVRWYKFLWFELLTVVVVAFTAGLVVGWVITTNV